MVKVDMLYQLDLRLKEIKQEPSKDFGGVAVFCFGDLLQLRPVKSNYIFQRPRCPDYHISYEIEPLWKTFRAINLIQNHRQGNDKDYADLLNRVSVGKHTEEEIATLCKLCKATKSKIAQFLLIFTFNQKEVLFFI